jgi:predicted nuclease with TOPRIM domain
MTSEEEKTIRLLETRTRQLILKFAQLKEDNEELLEELVKKDSELEEVKKQNKLLQANYANLKMARMLEVGDKDIAEARQRVARLVRDVDKCIALLKGMGLETT